MGKTTLLDEISTLPAGKQTKEEFLPKIEILKAKLAELQDKLIAQRKYSVLVILQGMDASGKDGTIKHLFSGLNVAGCRVKAFKVPTAEESAHHFLWRVSKECPEKGMLQIFNRSQYEEILVPKVNDTISDKLLRQLCEEINSFEAGLVRDNTLVFKFYLHVSEEEQRSRLAERMQDPAKRWKYQPEDIAAIGKHDDFAKVYEYIFTHCSKGAPWHIIPADKKWFRNHEILKILVEALSTKSIEYPEIPE
jgi:PPK2 family polyphosphate:nucleotide phosphotransferase